MATDDVRRDPESETAASLGDPQSEVSTLVAERGGYALMPEMGYQPVNRYLPPRPRRDGKGEDRELALAPAAPPAEGAHPFLRWIDRVLSR